MRTKEVVNSSRGVIGYIEEVSATWNKQSLCWMGEFRAYDADREVIDTARTENGAFNLIVTNMEVNR